MRGREREGRRKEEEEGGGGKRVVHLLFMDSILYREETRLGLPFSFPKEFHLTKSLDVMKKRRKENFAPELK